jgi:hypothetical protein
MKTATVLLFALLSVPLFAQVYTPQPGSSPSGQPGVPPQPPRRVVRPGGSGEERQGLDRNVTVRLAGELLKGRKVELALTGSGPRLSSQQFVGDDNQLMSCEFQFGEDDGGYRISYSVSVRVAVPVNQQPVVPAHIQYQDLSLNGTVVCKPDKAVEILRNGGRSLWLTVEEPAPADKPADPRKAEK